MSELEELATRLGAAVEEGDSIIEMIQGDHISEAIDISFNKAIRELSSIKTKLKALIRTTNEPKQVEQMQGDVERALEHLRNSYREAEARITESKAREKRQKKTAERCMRIIPIR